MKTTNLLLSFLVFAVVALLGLALWQGQQLQKIAAAIDTDSPVVASLPGPPVLQVGAPVSDGGQVPEVMVRVRSDSSLLVEEKVIDPVLLAKRLQTILKLNPNTKIRLVGDADTSYQLIVSTIQLVKEAGGWNIEFGTQPREEPNPPNKTE